MKKILLMMALMAIAAHPAGAASIVNSAHDLSSLSDFAGVGGATPVRDTDFDRVCAYCHTPHYANASAPLWNRSVNFDTTTLANIYDNTASATLTAASQAVTKASLNSTDAPLCLGCHDGTISGEGLVNEVNGWAGEPDTVSDAGMDATAKVASDGLSNDHPIGMNYSLAVTQDGGGLNTLADAETDGVKFYGTGGEFMWCASCHNVHDPGASGAGTAPFLKTSNTGSALCLACHAK